MTSISRVFAGALFGALLVLLSEEINLKAMDPQEPCVPVIDPYDGVVNHRNIQACLDRHGLVLLPDLGPYILLRHGLVIDSDTTLTSVVEGQKVKLLADPDMGNERLMSTGSSFSSNYHISWIIFDGNKYKRDYTNGLCWSPQRTPGNVYLRGYDFSVHDIESRDAVCAVGLGLAGRNFYVYNNRIENNGFAAGEWPHLSHQFADGMTVVYCNNGTIYNNVIGDNSDLDLVLGGGPNCKVFDNQIYHRHVFGFGGLNIGHFETGTKGEWDGNHTGSIFYNNVVESELNMLMYGLSVGSHPFSSTPDAFPVHDAGVFANNRSYGAQINFIVDGVANGEIFGNTYEKNRGNRDEYNEYKISLGYAAGHVGAPVKLQRGFSRIVCDGGKCRNE